MSGQNNSPAQHTAQDAGAPMDSRAIALKVASQMLEHRDRLSGKADDAQQVQQVLSTVGTNVDGYHDTHRKNVAALNGHWSGEAADKFHHQAKAITGSLESTAQSATKGSSIVGSVYTSLDAGHTAVTRLVDEYATKATAILDGARGVQGSGGHAALVKGVGQVVDLVRHYTAESASHVAKVNTEMTEAAKQLTSLNKHVQHDGYADPAKAKHHLPGKHGKHEPPKTKHAKGHGKDHDKGGKHTSAKAKSIVDAARKELGTTEHPPGSNNQKYGPTEYWCSLFTTWVWRKEGVNIPQYAFTGDVYTWGQQHHLAYDKNHLHDVRPGDVLLFGTGPENTTTSKHIALVESVHGNTVTTIEGNVGDAVKRQTHTLSSSTFYGGVHPS